MNETEILVYNREKLPQEWLDEKVILKMDEKSFKDSLKLGKYQFINREKVENDPNFKQIIPYVIIRNPKGEIITYQRQGNEKRIESLWSIGVGGHIDKVDNKDEIIGTIESCIMRELYEESCGQIPFDKSKLSFLGIINEEITKVGKVHLGAVYLLNTEVDKLDFDSEEDELSKHCWLSKEDILNSKKLEMWSEMALNLLESNKI
ncbi:MAG: hypothetical protein CR982_10555 [Candidatus Cloacimonadota bacterium]|nr:MAG: hypothetical protein CR982_10555 [Candidatus Cloacimonadota bacterium]PIE78639.1 MAG: hypothetical protein CSA15_07075 [Candidatus Delongbacteria bacterium]